MQKQVIIFLLSFISIRLFLEDQVTNEEAIQRRGNQIRQKAKTAYVNLCK